MTEKPIDLIAKYVSLRDQRIAAEKRFAEWRKENFDTTMDEIEGKLLDICNSSGVDSLKTKAGTAYKKSSVSVTTADGDAFRTYVIDTRQYELADLRPNKTAINEVINAGKPLPPGVNRAVFQVINVNRPKE